MNFSTTYLGMTLKNPIIVGSCGLTKTVDQIKACEDAGAGAVVMKSLMEEQIRAVESDMQDAIATHPEVMDYLRADIDMRYGADAYTEAIAQAKQAVTIPVIASVNCYTSKWWTAYAKKLEEAGTDALELNMYVMPTDVTKSAADIEDIYLETLAAVKARIRIPVALKLPQYFTAFGNFAARLEQSGADGLVLFNRFVQPEIDLTSLTTKIIPSFNDPVAVSRSLRWIGMLSGQVKMDLAASGGIRDARDIIKLVLAGASATQVVSVLYANGLGRIQEMLTGIEAWMNDKQVSALSDFQGTLNQLNNPQPEDYIRAHYVNAYSGIE